jgi:hypothetical protein
VARPHGGATGLSRFIDFIDENGGGPGGAATRAASAKTVGLLAPRCTPKITKRTHCAPGDRQGVEGESPLQ